MEEIEEEKLLNLSLAIVTDSSGGVERNRKRIRREFGYLSSPNLFSYHEGFEGKIFRLLQLREQMLKLDHKRKGLVHEDVKGLHLIHLLLITARAINENNVELALENLNELFQTVSLNGDSVQRVVAYFADGLAAKLLTKKSPFYEMIMKKPTSEEEFLAFMDLYRVSPYYQFAHFTANQVIIEAFEKEEEEKNNRALHIIDLDVSYGFQWPSLIQSLSEMASKGGGNNRISLRITGFGRSLEELHETENRLVSFSKGFRNLALEFHGLLRSNNNLMMMDNIIRRKRNETVALNIVFHLNTSDSISKISETLKTVQSLNPCIVVMVEKEGGRSPRSFLSRFMESLHYFAAMFDSLDDCLPLESSERLCIEKNHLGKEIKSMLNYEEDDHHEKIPNCLKYDQRIETSWKARMESHGFEGIRLSSKCMIQAKLLLKIRSHYCPLQFDEENGGGFKVVEKDDGRAISLGWQDRYLLTASAWHCRR